MSLGILFLVDWCLAFVQLSEGAKQRTHHLEDHASKCHRRSVAKRALNRKANDSLKEVRLRSKVQQVFLNKLKQSVKKGKARCHALVLKCKGLQKIVNTWRTPSLFYM